VVPRELEHADHQRDPDRVVGARLALENRARATADLPVAEHRKHDRRIGRGERGPEDAGERPREAKQRVRRQRHQRRGRERAEHAERGDLDRRGTEAPPTDLHPAVEEDGDQGDGADPLDLADRDVIRERREEVGRERGGKQEDRRAGQGEPLGQLA